MDSVHSACGMERIREIAAARRINTWTLMHVLFVQAAEQSVEGWDWTELAESTRSPWTDLAESASSPWTDLAESASSPWTDCRLCQLSPDVK